MVNIELIATEMQGFSLTALLSGHQNFLNPRFMSDTPAHRAVLNQIAGYAERRGVTGGKYFGPRGTTATNLILNTNKDTVIEITPTAMCATPPKILKNILENHRAVLSDFFESGLFFTGKMQGSDPRRADVLNFIKSNNVKPRGVYVLGSDYLMNDLPEYNIFQIRFNFWPLFVVLSSNDLPRTFLDQDFKNSQVQTIKEKHKKFAIALNRKVRKHRVGLLACLDQRGLLNHVDWSLWYDPNDQHQTTTHITKNVNKWVSSETDQRILNFLRRHKLPRIIGDIGNTDGESFACRHNDDSFLGSYHYSIVAETHCVAHDAGAFGSYSQITEKTYKAFFIGSMPLILGTQGMEKHLTRQGFLLTHNSYDSSAGSERVELLADYINLLYAENTTHTDVCIKNFLTATGLNWLKSQTIDPLFSLST